MTDPEDLPALSGETTCTRCGDTIDRGYVTAGDDWTDGDETGDGGVPAFDTGSAVCDACGWREIGAMGCAPTLSDFETGEVLVRIERADDELVAADVTDETDA